MFSRRKYQSHYLVLHEFAVSDYILVNKYSLLLEDMRTFLKDLFIFSCDITKVRSIHPNSTDPRSALFSLPPRLLQLSRRC